MKWPLTGFLICLLLSTVACGDSEEAQDPGLMLGEGEACEAPSDCASGLLCLGRVCRDPNNTPDMTDSDDVEDTDQGQDMPDEDQGSPDLPEDMGAEDTGPVDMGMEDTGQGEDTGSPDMPEADMGDRPEALTGGVSIFEARIKANDIINLRRGNVGAAFVVPTDEPAPVATFGDCDLVQFDPDPPSQVGYNAGPITITAGARNILLTPGQSGGSTTYTSSLPENNEDVFAPGATLMINGGGGPHVGPFVGSVTAPQDHAITTPDADDTVPAGALDVAWTAPDSGAEIALTLSPMNDRFELVPGMGLTCTTTDTGAFTIPADAMARLDADRIALVVIKVLNRELNVDGDTIYLNLTSATGHVIKR